MRLWSVKPYRPTIVKYFEVSHASVPVRVLLVVPRGHTSAEEVVVSPTTWAQVVNLLCLHLQLPVHIPGQIVAQLDRSQSRPVRDLIVQTDVLVKVINSSGIIEL